jgi:hypothetical protein
MDLEGSEANLFLDIYNPRLLNGGYSWHWPASNFYLPLSNQYLALSDQSEYVYHYPLFTFLMVAQVALASVVLSAFQR